MPFRYEGKCNQHCGNIIHVNSKLGFLNGLCWIEEVPQTIYGKCLGLWVLRLLRGIDQFSVIALFLEKVLLLQWACLHGVLASINSILQCD
jgi:hypothetical protein